MLSYRSKGMTLLELLIVISLIAIILAITVPSFSQMLERNRLKSAAESLKVDLQLAKTKAVKSSSDVIVTENTGDNGAWCYGYNISSACDCTQTDTTQANYCDLGIVNGNNFPKTNLESSSSSTTFTFRRGTANSGNRCLSTDNYKVKVTVSNVGKVEICSDSTAPLGGYDTCTSNCP